MLIDQQSSSLANGATTPFCPPRGLRNAHLQTVLSSIGPRRLRITKMFSPYESKQQEVLLNCGDNIRLNGIFNQASNQPSDKLAILIHGWEGSVQSSYMLAMSSHLLSNGIDVFRLNMRDHGDSHHLNEDIFNSTLIDEVIGGIEDLQKRYVYKHYHLIGFSLGGNFSLRVAALAHDRQISLEKVIAFCPVIHAKQSNEVLNSSKNWLYGSYFVRKWKRSLLKKLEHFPQYQYRDELNSLKTLDDMNEKLIPVYTQFSSVSDYFDAYGLHGEMMSNTICPCYLHFAKDDMIIPIEGVDQLANNPHLNVMITEHGGHCGFLKNWKFDSWQDQRALELILAN